MSNSIGTRLRAARTQQGLTLRALAAAIGVSPSLLSQVETGRTKPSVGTLYALVAHLEISTDLLLGREAAAPVQVETHAAVPSQVMRAASSSQTAPATKPSTSSRTERSNPAEHSVCYQAAGEHPTLEMENGVTWERLCTLDGTDVEGTKVTYQPGATSSIEGHFMCHAGVEHLYLVSGEMTLHIDTTEHLLRAGDSMAFDSQLPHRFVNAAETPAVGVWFATGRGDGSRGGTA